MSIKYDGKEKFHIDKVATDAVPEGLTKKAAMMEFEENLAEITVLQEKLYAERKEGVIFVFQAMDAAGKDGVIRTVFGDLTPHGVKEFCFKTPSSTELSHDFLWRFWDALPARGHISIFNRSYYEDVLIGKVHQLYKNQILPDRVLKSDVIADRYVQINHFEDYLYKTGTRVIKIFLNVSKDEQAARFLSRIDTPSKNWKVSAGDIAERAYWDDYQEAFESMINHTSTKNCPWYVVPADHKWFERLAVSRIVVNTLREMDPKFPELSEEELNGFADIKAKLTGEEKNKED